MILAARAAGVPVTVLSHDSKPSQARDGEMSDCGPCPSKLWCLVSGGKDSLTSAHVLASQNRLAGCVFVDTGIALPEVQGFVKDVCQERGWPLEVYRTPAVYESLVVAYEFPGPAMHNMFMNYLKMRGVRLWKKMHPGEQLASGVRQEESARRLAIVEPESIIEGVRVEAPIFDWSTQKVWDYISANNIPKSPGYKTLHLSGDCLCGAFAHPEERQILQTFHPDVWKRLKLLEDYLEASGIVKNQWAWKWGNRGGPKKTESSTAERLACETCLREKW